MNPWKPTESSKIRLRALRDVPFDQPHCKTVDLFFLLLANKDPGSYLSVDIDEHKEDDWMESEKKRRGQLPERYEPQWAYDLKFKPQPDFVPNPGVTHETMDKMIEYCTRDPPKDGKYEEKYGECKICLKVNEHFSDYCPYLKSVPKDVILGHAASVACGICDKVKEHHDDDFCTWKEGRAVLKFCGLCGKHDDHWAYTCEKYGEKYGKCKICLKVNNEHFDYCPCLKSVPEDGKYEEKYGECKICLKVNEHFSDYCPYLKSVPEGAMLGHAASLACVTCDKLKDHHDDLLCTWKEGHAVLKYCDLCGKYDDHWTYNCEKKKLRKRKAFCSHSTAEPVKAF